MEPNQDQNQPQTEVKPGQPDAQPAMKTLVGVLIVGLIAGVAGGVFGALDLAQRPSVQKFFGASSNGGVLPQNLVVNEESETIKVVEEASPAVVSIIISKDLSRVPNPGFFFQQRPSGLQEVGAGSGFFVSNDGLILTNRHVVSDEQASYTVVTSDGKSHEAEVLSRDPVNDLAIVKVDVQTDQYLSFADSSQVKLGEHVVAIGNSLGQYQNTVTSGIVSGIGRSISAGDGSGSIEQLEGVIQTDAAINPGNSGGPLLNLAGKVIGINTAIAEQGQSVGFAISSNDAKVALDSYRESGKITRPFIGVRYMMLNEALAKELKIPRTEGALLIHGSALADSAVLPGSPADKAGLKENDIILKVDGKALNADNSLAHALKSYRPGQTIVLQVDSGGTEKSVTLTLGEAP